MLKKVHDGVRKLLRPSTTKLMKLSVGGFYSEGEGADELDVGVVPLTPSQVSSLEDLTFIP